MPVPAATLPPSPRTKPVVLATTVLHLAYDPAEVVLVDRTRFGAVASHDGAGTLRRAEAGPAGPLLLEARTCRGAVDVAVLGPAGTSPEAVDAAVQGAAGWLGAYDDPADFAALAARHEVTRALQRRLGDVRLSRLPRLAEAVGRAIIAQLVQTAEARRSTAQLVSRHGSPAGGGLHAWPTRAQLGAAPAWALRRCGISLRGATALHAAAVSERRLEQAMGDACMLDRRLRTLPGVGVWTSAETRLALGDADAVSVGDWNIPDLVGHVLRGGRGDGPDGRWTDAAMLELLAPFAGQRGRVIRLIGRGVAAGLVRRPARRAPRAPLSAHRYW